MDAERRSVCVGTTVSAEGRRQVSAWDWPLDLNFIRRGLVNHTFGMVRRRADGSTRPHQGWDLFAAPGTPCYAVAAGHVAMIRTVGAYGNTIVLAVNVDVTGDGKPEQRFVAYSHLSRIDVKAGQSVHLGQQIGLTGNSGNAVSMRGPDCHLHLELRTMAAPGLGLRGRESPLALFRHYPLDAPVKRRGAN
jgi:murein DD-endopeptidase MepM/ murein hydrolase activator NlpD